MDVEKLIKNASESDALRLKIFNNAVVKTMRAYNTSPTDANKRNWDTAEKALNDFVDQVSEKNIKNDVDADELFSTKLDVWRFLKADGWEISRSRFYDYCRDGLLRPDRATGKYKLSTVDKFAKMHLRLAETGSKVNEKFDKMQAEKYEIELKQARVKLEKDQHDLDTRKGKYVSRDDFELAIVSRAVAFMAHLNHAIQASTPDWIELVGGDQQRAAELVHAVSAVVEQRMSDFAADAEFDVILEAN